MNAKRLTIAVAAVALCVAATSLASASQLSQVVTKGNHIIALNSLGVTTAQLSQLTPLSRVLVAAVKAHKAKRAELLEAAADDLATARWKLMGGDPLPADMQARLDQLEAQLQQADDDLYETAVDVMGDIEDEFTARQSTAIDWTPPKDQAKMSSETLIQRARRERDHEAMVMMAERFLQSIRYYPLEQYILQAQKLVDDFLRPLIDVRSPDYPAAREYMFTLIEEVRLLREPQWFEQGPAYAEQMIVDLGLQQPLTDADLEKAYNWDDMYAIFSDAAAPDLLTAMRAARTR